MTYYEEAQVWEEDLLRKRVIYDSERLQFGATYYCGTGGNIKVTTTARTLFNNKPTLNYAKYLKPPVYG